MRRSWDLRDFTPARKPSTDFTAVPLSASIMSPTASLDRAAGLLGKILPTRTWLSRVDWAFTPRNGRRGNSCAGAAEKQMRVRKTKMQLAAARFPTMSFRERIFRTSYLPSLDIRDGAKSPPAVDQFDRDRHALTRGRLRTSSTAHMSSLGSLASPA